MTLVQMSVFSKIGLQIPANAGILHIFNPETDYALASDAASYTPPAIVADLRRRGALLPLRFAAPGDAILCLDDPNPADVAAARDSHPDVEIISPAETRSFFARRSAQHRLPFILPWGWNRALRNTLIHLGAPPHILPSEDYIDRLRHLSHRRTTIRFNSRLNAFLAEAGVAGRHLSPLPVEFTDADEAADWAETHYPAFFKAPWSSSGRGILYTGDIDHSTRVRPWLKGIVKRQGSVIGETAAEKALDFATEFFISSAADGSAKVDFIGLSVFNASERGKYHGNVDAPQSRLLEIIRSAAPDFGKTFIEAQRAVLAETVGDYRGPVGIDMLATPDGTIRACIEINFRLTMGQVSMLNVEF